MPKNNGDSDGEEEWLAVAKNSSGDVGTAIKSESPKASAACIRLSLGSLMFFQIITPEGV